MKNLILTLALSTIIPLSFAQGSLESPVAGSTESGISVISGWHCTANKIEVTIDGVSLGKAGSGTGRDDTVGICGHAETGYSLLYNYNDLPTGSHNISVYADGQLLDTRQFNTTQSAGASFVTGLSKTGTIFDFPSSGRAATLQWSQAKQSFVVTGISEITSGGVDLSSLQGTFNQSVSITSSGSTCVSDDVRSGNVNFTFNFTTNGSTLAIKGYTSGDECTMRLTYVSGNSTSGFNFSGTESCIGGLPVNLTATNIIKINNRIHGIITGSWPSCTVQTNFS